MGTTVVKYILLELGYIYRDYHITFFVSDTLSALVPDISVRELVGSRADEGSDMENAMLLSFYHILGTRRHFRKLMNYNV